MEKFLKKAANKILNDSFTGPNSIVILPNRRSEVFLKQELKSLNNSDIWLPDFYPISEFFQRISRLTLADSITTGFELFQVYNEIESVNAKPVDDFLTWASMIINDFNDIDNALVDASKTYEHLTAIKAIQQWNPDGRSLTSLQNNYLNFFNSMYSYYAGLKNRLITKGIGYQGMINRHVAENIGKCSKDLSWNRFLIVGINALSESEISAMKYIYQNYETEFLWDLDNYYYNNIDNNYHEAGKHIRHIITRLNLKPPEDIESNLANNPKSIRVLGIPKNIGQVKFIGQELLENQQLINSKTAIVLGNEQLLIPLLNSLPKSEDGNKYNLTLGYPLANSIIEHFFVLWVDAISSIKLNKDIETGKLINLLNNPLVKLIIGNKIEKLINEIIKQNTYLISETNVQLLCEKGGVNIFAIISSLFNDYKINDINDTIINLKNTLLNSINKSANLNFLFKEQIHNLIQILGKLSRYVSENIGIIQYSTLKKIGKQLIGMSKLNLIGEPLEGLQIMGMLETRTLDFDNVYVLSVNEGELPKTSSIDSFIPFDIRRDLKLPLPSDKSEIYTYHFYRLLQRSKNVTLIYSSDTDAFGGGEKSRFILQLKNELIKQNKNIDFTESIITTEVYDDKQSLNNSQTIEIVKSDDIINMINNISIRGYSASLLITYITCPLKFYFSQILQLNTSKPLEQSIEANTFGTVVHEVLENVYIQFKGKKIEPTVLKDLSKIIDRLLIETFTKYKIGNLSTGKNLLIFEVAKKYVKSIISWDIKELKKSPSTLISTEFKLFKNISINGLNNNFKGTVDRVDDKTKHIRIIDYKTGFVEPKHLKVTDVEELFTNPEKSKAFQVMYYAWLYSLQFDTMNLETGIISTRSISNGFMPLLLKEYPNINEYFDGFGSSVFNLINEIKNQDLTLSQTADTERCKYCDYKNICNR